jgi:1-acyl-sn-glycerol-3-phosphate acyltransferase
VRVTGVVDIVRFPRRPRLVVEVFEPAGGPPSPEESAVALTKRVMTEVRAGAPPALGGRDKTRTAQERALAEG